MAKQLNIDMRFNADTSAAKAQLQSLQTSINQLTTSMATQGTQLGITPKIQEAQQAAVQLKTALSQSMNVETGKFDLSKFNSSLKSMNTDLSKLKTQLVNLGPSGQQTFMTLAQSIMTAEIPTKRISASLAALGTTLKNTAKWQLSSTMLHGFMSAVQTSYRYAQDLNQSLNSIRIVTGESAEAMDRFAARANKAAKALSASTLDYTDAALIFYQQGLKGKEVEERTEVTLKMANVSRQSAEVVSDQMTAIWNNFYDGSQSLESFADKMVALGAATASSSDEIAGGLEKFAAVGETIGLSFDYAAAALATITSNTRQSEEVVGTALKTIFARMQSLKLGETLEDGTELNKYTEALQTAGISIFDANNQLKDMDTILTETAGKWKTLGKDQKVALANTVAGVRQYNQFVALMDNWDDGTGDSMVANLKTAANAAGSLQKQADIYAESWEAANKRVKASAEALYTSLLNDDFFIDLSNGLADLLDKIKVIVETLGGVKSILLGLSGILLHTFSGAAAQGLENMVYNLRSFIGLAQKDALNMKNQVAGMITNLSGNVQLTNQQQGALAGAQQQVQLQNEINQLSSKWTDQQKAQAQNIMEINRLYGEQVALLGEAADKANQQKQTSKSTMLEQSFGTVKQFNQSLYDINEDIDISSGIIEQANKLEKEFAEGKVGADAFRDSMQALAESARAKSFGGLAEDLEITSQYGKRTVANKDFSEDAKEKRMAQVRYDIQRKRSYNENEPRRNRGMRGVDNEEIVTYIRNTQDAKGASDKFAEGQKALKEATAQAKQELQNLNKASRSWSQTAVGVAQGISSIGFGIQSLSSMFKTLTDDSASFSDKLLSAFIGLGMAVPMLINGFNGLKTAIMGSNTVMTLSVALGKAEVTTLNAQQLAKMTGMSIESANQALEMIGIALKTKEAIATGKVTAEQAKENLIKQFGTKGNILYALATGKVTLAKAAEVLGLNLSFKALVKNTWAAIAGAAAQIKLAVATAIAKAVAGDFSGVIILATAAVVAGTAALLGYAAAQEQDNKKISEANEKLDSATKAYERATQRAQEFKDVITGYEEAVDSLEDLVTGTDEYTAALEKANAEAAKMLEMYPDMKYTVENGLIKINSADMAEYYKKLRQQEQMFKTIKLQAEAEVKKAENEKMQKDINKQSRKEFGIKNYSDTSVYDRSTQMYVDKKGANYNDEFVEYLKKQDYNKQEDILNNKEDLIDLFNQIKKDASADYGTNQEFEQWADNIVNSSEQEKQAILENIKALNNNTAALKAEVQASQQQKYGEKFIAEHGEAEVYGAEIELAKQKQDQIDYNVNKAGNQSSYADYIDDIMNLANNTDELNDSDAAIISKIFGIDESTFDGRELRVRQGEDGGMVYLSGSETEASKDGNKDKSLKMSIEEFDAYAAVLQNKLEYTEGEITEFLKTGLSDATQAALDSGLYNESDMLTHYDPRAGAIPEARAYSGITVGQRSDFQERFENTDIEQKTEDNIIDWLGNVDRTVKQKVADRLLELSNETLNEMDEEDFKAIEEEEREAFMERDLSRVAQDQANIYGLDAQSLKDVAEGFRELGDEGHEAYKNIKDDSEALVDAARVYMRMNGAIVDLRENYDDYSKTLNNIQKAQNPMDKAMAKNSESAKKLRKSLAGLLDTQEDMVDSDLLEAIDPKDLEKAAKGDIAAINRIRDAFIDLQVKGIEGIDAEKFKQELNALEDGEEIKIDGEISIGLEEFISQLVLAEMIAGASEIDIESKLSGMGISCDAVQFYDTLEEAQKAAADTGGIIVDNLSFDTTQTTGTVETEGSMPDTTVSETWTSTPFYWSGSVMEDGDSNPQEVSGSVPALTKSTNTTVTPKPFGSTTTGVSQQVTNGAGKTGKGTGKVAVVQGPRKKAGQTYNPNYDSNGTTRDTSGGGGGGSKPKKTSEAKKKKSDIVDRYKEVNDQLAKTQRLMDKNSTLADTLWGPDKIKKIQESTKALEEENKWLEEKIKLQKQYLQVDKGELVKAASDAGLNFEFGEEGTILNYTIEMTKLHNQREAMLAGFGDEMDETEQETLEKFDEKIEAVTSAYETYEETLNEGFEFDQEKLENEIEQMENRFQEIELKLEVEIELNENDIADIEHQLERLGDSNVYASAERIALIEKSAASYRNIADAQIESMREAERLYQDFLNTDGKSGISKGDYMARLQESKEALQEAEMSIRDGIAQIGDELENTFDLVDEKLDQQFTKFDQLIELMDHYKNIVSLTEGEASYKEFNKILKASQEVLRDRIAADESEVAMWTARREQLEVDIATLPEDSPAKREAEEALQAIMEKEADAKSQLMADIEQLGEYAREIFENSIEQAMKDFEDEMFGRPLNSIIESIEMMNSRQEELLTTTNKIYETNKLIRSVEKDIEATTNNRAKQAFAEFQNKVKQKQEQNELTKFELDLLTAEYEMTKAQIALEEAQNAKDTVRLTRDAEGNYGYVYTANEDKVADAEQALDDATNNYYNTALEGAQKYQDQIYQHIQEWEEKVKEVYLDQTLSEEEKNKKIKEITDTYNTLITQDKELYYMAIGAMQEESYNNQVDYDLKGIKSAENWFTECDGFLSDLEKAQDEYDRNTKEVSKHTEENFGKMSTAIKNTKRESEYLKNQIVEDLVPELDTTLKDSIDNATEAWWKYIEALQEVIRLTDEAMKKNSDEKYYGTIDDFSQEIYNKISSGEYDINDPEIQALIERRWKKMGGKDTYDYDKLMANNSDPFWQIVYAALKDYAIGQGGYTPTSQTPVQNTETTPKQAEPVVEQKPEPVLPTLEKGSYIEVKEGTRWYANSSGGGKSGKAKAGTIKYINLNGSHPYNIEGLGWIRKEDIVGYDTGGYTGDWGPEGKLAVLHQKELVLDAQDTENFLSATNILREISQMLDRDALIASLGAINLQAMTLNSPADQVLQQEVTIHADFPNVTDHNEIEIAIDNLINAASQHAYRT